MSVTGIVTALAAEARTIHPAARIPDAISQLEDGTLLIIGGMGAAAASHAAARLIGAGARRLLSFGLAGALDPDLSAGSVLLPQSVIDGCGGAVATDASWRASLGAHGAGAVRHEGSLLGVAEPLATPAAKALAWQRTGARAVDMESFAIGQVALAQALPFAVARVVVDEAADRVPASVTAATDAWGRVRAARLATGLLANPGDVGALYTLGRRFRAARRALTDLARGGLRCP